MTIASLTTPPRQDNVKSAHTAAMVADDDWLNKKSLAM